MATLSSKINELSGLATAAQGVLADTAVQPNDSSVAKVWVGYTPSSATILDSANVSSLTDNGTGDASVSYTSSMASSNYAQTCSAVNDINVSPSNVIARVRSRDTQFASTTRLSVGYSSASSNFTLFDYPYAATTIHGDLA